MHVPLIIFTRLSRLQWKQGKRALKPFQTTERSIAYELIMECNKWSSLKLLLCVSRQKQYNGQIKWILDILTTFESEKNVKKNKWYNNKRRFKTYTWRPVLFELTRSCVMLGHYDSFHSTLSRPSTIALRNSSLWRIKEETCPPVTHLTSEPGHAFWSSNTECFGMYPSSYTKP